MPNTWTSVSRQWSGKHKRVVQGINLTSLLWSTGDKHIHGDYRLYEKAEDGATKNDHFRAMLTTAKERGFKPKCVAFDSWFSALANLKLIASNGWIWLTRLKRNRLVNPDRTGNDQFVTSRSPQLVQWFISKAMGSFKYSRLLPQTVTLTTGPPMT